MTPWSDVCTKCESSRFKLKNAVWEEELSADFTLHVSVAQQERDYYLDCMKKAEAELAQVSGTRSKPKYAHYTFDFAEQVHIPYHSCQVGPIYFKVCQKINYLVFVVIVTENKLTI